MSRSMRPVVLFAFGMTLAPAATGCRDQALGDSYPMVLEADGRPLLPTTGRTYDARIREGTAQAIGLQGDDGSPPVLPDRKSAEPSSADGASPVGAIRDAFRNLNDLARKAFGGPQPVEQPDDPDSDDSNQ